MFASQHLRGFLELPRVESDEEKRSLWRQAMATLARAALEQQPVPLEGLDPQQLHQAVRDVFKHGLLDDLDWLSPPGAAAAVYELALALPDGPERRQLGRRVLQKLYEGDVETFVVLATSLAAESKRMLTGAPIRARLALALELPLGSGIRTDALALMLISRPELRREWLTEPASGSLPSRRLAARLLERAARESARRAAQGDGGSLTVFSQPAVRAAWQLLFNDRESLVWRHVATARGLLSRAIAELGEEIESQLDPKLTPTEWRRAAVSLSASIAAEPHLGLMRCKALLESDTFRSDPGLGETMVFGLGRAAEVEPEAVEDLLEHLAKSGGIEVAEALVELRRERVDTEVGVRAAQQAHEKLHKWLSLQRFEDDGRIALCEVLSEELAEPRPNLRHALDLALRAFAERDARHAFIEAQTVFQAVAGKLSELERAPDDPAGRRQAFRSMREIDSALLETAALSDLLSMGGKDQGPVAAAALGDLFERLTSWLLKLEAKPVQTSGAVPHLSLRMRRMRTLLHVVDADGSYGEDVSGQRRARRLRVAKTLLGRARTDAPSPLRRIVCAALARALDALVRDEVCELSDVLVAVADHVVQGHDVSAVAEASMLPDFQRSLAAYGELARAADKHEASGRNTRHTIDMLRQLAEALPWAGTLRVTALRGQLLALARRLEDIAAARTLRDLAEGPGHDHLVGLDATVSALIQLTEGARRRLVQQAMPHADADSGVLGALTLAVERADREGTAFIRESLDGIVPRLERALPLAVAKTVLMVLRRVAELPPAGVVRENSFAPASPKETPLPPWLTGRRTIGGFYVLHPLGAGGVGSVFVVTRAEERHREEAKRFALKVPDYNAEAARTLSEEEFLNLFRQEAGALLALPRHPNLAGFVTFDAGARPKPILVMELVEGPTLERMIERGDLDISRVLEVLDGIGAGLQGMHRSEIGHLDVKPSNVIMRAVRTPQGEESLRPVLVDFGLAGRHLRPGCATGPYGAPEIWGLVPPSYEPKPMEADVYAYSCLAYEALTGDTLFDGPSELAVIQAHLSHDGFPDKLQALCAKKGMQILGELIGNGLRRHPGERISVQEMREGFQELRQSLSKLEWPLRAA